MSTGHEVELYASNLLVNYASNLVINYATNLLVNYASNLLVNYASSMLVLTYFVNFEKDWKRVSRPIMWCRF